MADPHAVLGVEKDASADDLRSAYRRLAFELHPDRTADPDAAERLREVNQAYDQVVRGESRARGDARPTPVAPEAPVTRAWPRPEQLVAMLAVIAGLGFFGGQLAASNGGRDLASERAAGIERGTREGAAEGRRLGRREGRREGLHDGRRAGYEAGYAAEFTRMGDLR